MSEENKEINEAPQNEETSVKQKIVTKGLSDLSPIRIVRYALIFVVFFFIYVVSVLMSAPNFCKFSTKSS